MFIKDLQSRQSGVEIEAKVVEMGDVREFNKMGRQGRVANAIIDDGTGKIKLSLWNDQIAQVSLGDTVKVQKGYVNEFKGELQLTTGKFGSLDVVKSEEHPDADSSEVLEKKSKQETSVETEQKASGSEVENETAKQTALSTPDDADKKEEDRKEAPPDETLDVEEEDFS